MTARWPIVITPTGFRELPGGDTLAGAQPGFRNKLINGKMDVSQRNGATVMPLTATATYFNDRWACMASATPSGVLTTGKTTIAGALGTVQPGDGFTNCLYIQRQSGTYSGYARVAQVLETVESLSLAGRTVTLSFWLAINSGWLGGNVTASVVTGKGTDQTAAQFFAGTASGQATAGTATVTPTTTLTRYSLTVSIPSDATQVAVMFQNAGWSGSGAPQDIAAITGVQLELGSTSTPFEHRHQGLELLLCKRYCQAFYGTNSAVSFPTRGAPGSGNALWLSIVYSTEMRSSPTAVVVGTWSTFNCPQPTVTQAGPISTTLLSNASAAGDAFFYASAANVGLVLSAEL
jgi:hypothetical protein